MIISSSLGGMNVVRSVLNEGGSLKPIAKIPVIISASTIIGRDARSRTAVNAASRGSTVRDMILSVGEQAIIPAVFSTNIV